MDKVTIGFIGLGNMGVPMATNVVAAGHTVVAFDSAGTEARAPKGTRVANGVECIATSCETLLLSLPDGNAVTEVARQIISTPQRTARVMVDHSTIGVEAARAVHGLLATAGIAYLDAPVSGGTLGARQGTLALMASGDQALFDRLDPVLAALAKNRFYIGPEPGQGQAMKLLNNFLSATAMAATSEAVAFGESLGLDPRIMIDVFNASSGQNTATSDKFPRRILTKQFDAGFTIDLLTKDVNLYLEEVAKGTNQDVIAQTVGHILKKMMSVMPGADFTKIYPFTKEQSKRN